MKLLTLILVLISSLARAMPIYTVTSINATVLSGTSVRVDWTDVSTIAGYTVERCSSNCTLITGSWTLVGLIPSNIKSFTDTGLTPGTTYRWRVAEDPYMSASATPTSTTVTTTSTTTTATGTTSSTTLPPGNLLGFIPSAGISAFDIVIDSSTSRAYVASNEFGLSILDVSSTSSIPSLGASLIPFKGARVSQSGAIACVTENGVGIHFIDVTSPTAPVYKSRLIGTFKSCVVSGTKVLTIRIAPGNPASTKFSVIDVSNLSNPSISVELDLGTVGSTTGLSISGNTAAVAFGTVGVKLINITNLAAPSLLSTLDTPDTAIDVAITSSNLYIADTTKFLVADISNLSNPSIVGTLATAVSTCIVSGSTAYAVDGVNLKIINVSNANSPSLTSSTNITVATGGGLGRIAFKNNNVYITDTAGDGSVTAARAVFVYDVTNPSSPVAGPRNYQVYPSNGVAFNTSKIGVAVNGGVATPANNKGFSNAPGLKVIDASVNTVPVVRGTLIDSNLQMYGVAINGNTVYTTEVIPGNPAHSDFITVDISSPASPTIRGRVTMTGSLYTSGGAGDGITNNGSTVYLAESVAGLQVINASSITNPVSVSILNTPGQASCAIYDPVSGRVFVCDLTAFLAVNVNTTPPTIVGSMPINATHAAIANGKAYVGDGINLRVVNISNPTSMSQIGSTLPARTMRYLVVSGNRLFGNAVAPGHPADTTSPDGIQIWDISGTPTFIKQAVVPGSLTSLMSINSLIYVGDNASIIDVLSPTN